MRFEPSRFKEHEVTIYEQASLGGVPFEFLRWQKPGTSVGLINFILKGHELFVSGDWHSATYAWSELADLVWIATCDTMYFNSKCEASPEGRIPKDWDAKECMKQMRDQIRECCIDDPEAWPVQIAKSSCALDNGGTCLGDSCDVHECDDCVDIAAKKVTAFWEQRIEDSGAESAAHTQFEWLRWLEATAPLQHLTPEEEARYGMTPTNAQFFFGEDWVHYHPNGDVLAFTSVVHLEALKQAIAWLKKSKEKYHKGDEVHWTDPDEGACSRTLQINTIEYLPDDVVRITGNNGVFLECLLSELTCEKR